MFRSNYFTTSQCIKINKCLAVIEGLAENDSYLPQLWKSLTEPRAKPRGRWGSIFWAYIGTGKKTGNLSRLNRLSSYPLIRNERYNDYMEIEQAADADKRPEL